MAFFTHTCPHCGVPAVAMSISGCYVIKKDAFVLAECNGCHLPACAMLQSSVIPGTAFSRVVELPDHISTYHWHVKSFWPAPPTPAIPSGLPSQVARAFIQAEDNFLRKGMEEVAAGAYGRALDIGTKLIAPDFKGMLYARIRHLAETGRITADLADWAHEIRTIRNDALHEIDGINRHELTAIRGLTDMVLRYLFTLPEMVKARKAEAKAA